MITKPENLNEQTLAAINHLESHALKAHVEYNAHCQTKIAANILRARFRVAPDSEIADPTIPKSNNPIIQ